MNNILKILDSTNTIKKNMPKIIDAFVSVYGEDKREFITDKLNNTIIIGYYDSNTLSHLLTTEYKNITDEIVRSIFEKHNIEYNEENLDKYLGSGNTFEYPTLIPAIDTLKYIEMVKKGKEVLKKEKEKELYDFVSRYVPDLSYENFINKDLTEEQISRLPIYIQNDLENALTIEDPDITLNKAKKRYIKSISSIYSEANEENIDELIKSGALDDIYNICLSFQEGITKFKDYCKINLKIYEDLCEKTKAFENTIKDKNYISYILELKEYLNQNDQKKLEELIATKKFNSFSIYGLRVMLGSYLSDSKSIDYFDEKSDQDLLSFETTNYRKETIKRNRIKYFKYRGIDLGDNYNDYASNPSCISIWPKKEDIARINERMDYYLNKSNIEIYTNNDFYLDVLKEAQEKQLLDKDNMLNPSTFMRTLTCIYPNLHLVNGEYKLMPIVAIYSKETPNADELLIHEFNHVIELSLTEVDGNNYNCICGWDICNCKFNQDEITFDDTIHIDRPKRDYELFSEIINELLAQKVVAMLHEKGTFVLADENNYKDTHGTSYERTAFLIRDFMDKYLDEIIASRKGNIEIIWNKVGKENFDRLNDLFHEFSEAFPEFRYYKLIDDMINNLDSELVRKFNEIKDKRDMILEAMEEYSKSNQTIL